MIQVLNTLTLCKYINLKIRCPIEQDSLSFSAIAQASKTHIFTLRMDEVKTNPLNVKNLSQIRKESLLIFLFAFILD